MPASQVRTFLIADIRGYTAFTLQRGDEAAARLSRTFASIARDAVAERQGEVIELRGDEALAVFDSARAALWAAVELQARLLEAARSDPTLHLRAGIGLDAGEAVPVDGGYRGAALNLAARLCSLAAAGEVLASDTVINIARRLDGLDYRDRGAFPLKGFEDQVHVVQIVRQESGEEADASPAANGTNAGPSAQPLPIGGFLGALPTGPLVARERELGQVLAAIDAVAAGQGRTVLLAGEPGAGKTRLGQEATLALQDRGFIIAAGRCYEPEGAVPYYPFLDALSTAYTAAPSSLQREATGRWPQLGLLLPDHLPPPEMGAGGGDQQQRVLRAATGFLRALAAIAPVAILLDDLHWADTASLKLVQHLTEHTRADRVLLLATFRDVEVGRYHPLEGVLRELMREDMVERIPVRRLDRQGTALLVAGTMGEESISDEFVELLYERTDGNPYFVQQVLRVLVEGGNVYRQDGHWERRAVRELEVPESIRSVVGQRLARLSERAQDVLYAASVLGQTFYFDDLLQLTELSEGELEAALEEAGHTGLVRESEGETYRFDHALTQQSLYGELSVRRRRRLHARAGQILEALPERSREDRTEQIAWHFLRADEQESALRWTLRGADHAAALYAHADAELHYRTALELARELEDGPRQAEALEKLGEILGRSGRHEESLGILDDAIARYTELRDRAGECRAVALYGRACARTGRVSEGIARVEACIAAAGDTAPTLGLIELVASLGLLQFTAGRLLENAQSQKRLLNLAQVLGSQVWIAHAAAGYGSALQSLGRVAEGQDAMERALPPLQKLNNLEALSVNLHNLADGQRMLGRFDRMLEYQEQGAEVAERLGAPDRISFHHSWLGYFQFLRGDWEAARRHCEHSLSLHIPDEHSWFAVYPLLFLGYLDLLQGKAGAGERLAQAGELAASQHDVQALFELAPALVMQGALSGDTAAVIPQLEATLRASDAGPPIWDATAVSCLAWAHVEAGDTAQGLRLARQAAGGEIMRQAPFFFAQAQRILGTAHARSGQLHEARAVLDGALALAQSIGWPCEEALTLHESARLAEQEGRRERAAGDLQRSIEIFTRLKAQPLLQRAAEKR